MELADFRLFVNAGLMIFDRDNNNKFVAMLGVGSGEMLGAVVGVKGTNLIVTSDNNNILVLGEIYRDAVGEIVKYRELGTYSEGLSLRFVDLHLMVKGEDIFVMGSLAKADEAENIYKGATVVKIVLDSGTGTHGLVLQEKWMS